MAEMHHDKRGYTVTLTNTEYDKLKMNLFEARDLILHFQFIAHGPGCDCDMCKKRAAFLTRTAPTPPAETEVGK